MSKSFWLPSEKGSHSWESLTLGSKFFPSRVDPFQKRFGVHTVLHKMGKNLPSVSSPLSYLTRYLHNALFCI